MIEKLPQSTGNTLAFLVSGKLHDDDYKHFVPIIDAAVAAHGKVRLMAQFHDFHGWDMHALWDDTKFATKHCSDVERIALVGDKKWEEWMAKICAPFTRAKIQDFDVSESAAAWSWLTGPA